jgi:O-antigen ligase
MLENAFYQSLIYRSIYAFIQIINKSFLARSVERFAKIITDSKTASFFRFIASRLFYPDGALFYRVFEKLNKKSMSFRDKAFIFLKESMIFRVLTYSKSFQVISHLLVPGAALYAFIDEVGRDFLAGFSLFNLWDEIYLLICAFYVFVRWFFFRRYKPLHCTPVGIPLVFLIATAFYLLVKNTTYPQLGIDGFRVVAQYVLWFFIMNSYLTDDKKAYTVTKLLVYLGGAMGIHGILQYIMKVPTPRHWTDAAEGNTATRVFSIVESPNILGSVFTLLIPICLALVLQRKRKFSDRLVFFVLLGTMGLSLILTLSRGAWLGAAFALFIFCLSINPRWLILLAAGGSTALFIPAVSSRIQYMLSPQYLINSLTSGRLMRYQKGWELFLQNKEMGVGLGHFGGAVAMNNKHLIPDTFYMDNFWLKTAVEMGIMGIIAYGAVIAALVIWSIRSIKHCKDYDTRLIAAGGFAGLCGVLLHNLIENIFEVPYMVVYFWIIASLVLYFGLRKRA